jgi:hemoglobin
MRRANGNAGTRNLFHDWRGRFRKVSRRLLSTSPSNDLLGPIYPASDLPGAEQRLRDFLIGRFGGPQTYIEQRGHPRLRARHSPFAINQTIRDRWMRLMENALGEASLPSNAEEVLREFLNEMSTFMINQSEPGIS